ncbi:MAG: DNA double-strand break repair nuclease NurA [Conexivisphaera sp.]
MSEHASDTEANLKLVNDVARLAEDEGRNILQIDSKLKSIAPRDLGLSVLECDERPSYSVHDKTYCAVDGSVLHRDMGDAYLILAKAALVRAARFGGEIPYEVVKKPKMISDYVGENNVNNNAIRFMLNLETELLGNNFESCDVIFVDGPIVDPPVAVTSLGADEDEDVPSLRTLAKKRADLFRKILEQDKLVIGIVKRFSQRFLLGMITNKYHGDPGLKSRLKNAKERYVAARLMSNEGNASSSPMILGWINWDEHLSGSPEFHEISSLLEAYGSYRNEWNGIITIYSGYYRTSLSSPPVRIDVPVANGRSDWIDGACRAISRWRIEGEAEAVLLDYLADTYAKVTLDELSSISALYRSVKTKKLFESNDEDAMHYVLQTEILSKKI